ncbi:MAG: protoporphyrinogen oxidase [Prevotella sp.]|nr:protoporphyrinogen oxidase [Prevotella sp.]
MTQRDTIVIGAGITGLTTAFQLRRRQVDVEVLECQNRVGGQIHTFNINGFTFESGPNTGVVKHPEVAELFEQLGDKCELETALASSKRRLIWKGNRFHDLPSSLPTALATPLFTWKDKLRILGEPWRKRGTDPNETVGSLAERRLGKSYVDYAVDPFLSGVYASDPYLLPTRLALPKLYQLEQDYGSFIRGSIAKARQLKTERDRKATKAVFSARGGFNRLVDALAEAIGDDRITTSARHIRIIPEGGGWLVSYEKDGKPHEVRARRVVTTCGAYSLPDLLPFIDRTVMTDLSNLYYVPVVQIGVGISDTRHHDWPAFGGLVPSREQRDVLGILFPSSCFAQRAPEGGIALAYFMGGTRHPEMVKMSDEELTGIVNRTLVDMLKYPAGTHPDTLRIFRHERAIPQYEVSTDRRLAAIDRLRELHPTLTIAGNLRDGIGIGDRIKQGFDVASNEKY